VRTVYDVYGEKRLDRRSQRADMCVYYMHVYHTNRIKKKASSRIRKTSEYKKINNNIMIQLLYAERRELEIDPYRVLRGAYA